MELQRVRSQVRQITCSECGAPIDLEHDTQCKYCHAPIMGGKYDWVLARIAQVNV